MVWTDLEDNARLRLFIALYVFTSIALPIVIAWLVMNRCKTVETPRASSGDGCGEYHNKKDRGFALVIFFLIGLALVSLDLLILYSHLYPSDMP